MLKSNFLFSLLIFILSSCVTTSSKNSKSPPIKSFNSDPWIQDFEQLKGFLAESYPNLEWMIENRKLNLPKMSQNTVAKLKAVSSDDDAKKILKEFLEQFGDPHLKLVLPNSNAPVSSSNAPPTLTRDTPGEVACERPGAKPKNVDFLFPKDAGFQELSAAEDIFKFGILNDGKKRSGIIRIHSFVPAQFPTICVEEWNSFRKTISGECDDDCQDTFIHDHVENRLLSELAKTLERIKAQKTRSLILDLTHNGGGTSWEEGAREMMTTKKMTCGQTGFIRHPHWVKHFEMEISELQRKREKSRISAEKLKLAREIAKTEQYRDEAKIKCNRDEVWLEENFKPSCSLVVKFPKEDCHVSDNYKYKRGIYNGPLFVLVDNGTASASEDIVARFKENRVAKIIGEKTLGAGCGYLNGGIPYKLSNSRLPVKIPNCVRFFGDGGNEVAGIEPDISLDMKKLKQQGFLSGLLKALD